MFYQKFRNSLSRHKVKIAALMLVLILTAVWWFKAEIRYSIHWQYLTQILTGNWNSEQPSPSNLKGEPPNYISDWVYTIGLFGAIVINFGPLLAIIGAIWGLVDRRTNMKLVSAFASRDLTLEGNVVRTVMAAPEVPLDVKTKLIKEIETSIAEARADWWGPLLDERYGREQADKLRGKMRDMNINP